MLIFGGSVNCLPWVYGPEVLPLHARAKGNALAVSAIWLWNFFVVITTVIINRLQWKAYLIFTCLYFSFIPILYFFYPETTNPTFEEIDQIHPASFAGEGGKAAAGSQREGCGPRRNYARRLLVRRQRGDGGRGETGVKVNVRYFLADCIGDIIMSWVGGRSPDGEMFPLVMSASLICDPPTAASGMK